MIIGVPKEICPGEQRVALTPANVSALLKKDGVEIIIERTAGDIAGYPDSAYQDAGAKMVDRDEVFSSAQVVLQVQTPGSNTVNGEEDLEKLKEGQTLIGMTDPLANPQFAQTLAAKKVSGLALELIPRITRAQAMDVLSSMAMIAGYKCVLLAAAESQRMFPMNMTAAGTMNASRVFVMGAGVAGLQACATAKRLGAIVSATDVRPAAKEQVESLGGKFVMVESEETAEAETEGGYAKEMSEDYKRKQAELVANTLKKQDIAICTALIPGKKAPELISEEMVRSMKPGSVIIDLAVEQGGNCPLSKPGEVVDVDGVKVVGHINVPSRVATDASSLFAKNLVNFITPLVDAENKQLKIDWGDEIVAAVTLTRDGQVVHPAFKGG